MKGTVSITGRFLGQPASGMLVHSAHKTEPKVPFVDCDYEALELGMLASESIAAEKPPLVWFSKR